MPEKASNEINYTAAIQLREGLQRLIDWRVYKAEVEARRDAQRWSYDDSSINESLIAQWAVEDEI